MITSRRNFITGLVSFVAAPAIVRAGSLMPVKVIVEPVYGMGPIVDAFTVQRIINIKRMLRDASARRCWANEMREIAPYVLGER